jgi:hypothetical protein
MEHATAARLGTSLNFRVSVNYFLLPLRAHRDLFRAASYGTLPSIMPTSRFDFVSPFRTFVMIALRRRGGR